MIEALASHPTALAAVCTIIGGVLLKVSEKFLNRHVEARNDRRDFREEIKELNERIDTLEAEITDWRSRYYREQEEVAALRLILIRSGLVPPEIKP